MSKRGNTRFVDESYHPDEDPEMGDEFLDEDDVDNDVGETDEYDVYGGSDEGGEDISMNVDDDEDLDMDMDDEPEADEDEGADEIISQMRDLLGKLSDAVGEDDDMDDDDDDDEEMEIDGDDNDHSDVNSHNTYNYYDDNDDDDMSMTRKESFYYEDTMKDKRTSGKPTASKKGRSTHGFNANNLGVFDPDEVWNSVAKAATVTNKDVAPKAKAMLSVVNKLAGMSTKQIKALNQAVEHGNTRTVQEDLDTDFSEEVAALISLDDSLSEEFKTGAAALFESALTEKVNNMIDIIEAKYAMTFAEEIESAQDDMVEKVDDYLNYVVEEFFKENKLAIEDGIKTEVSESFMDGLRGLFEDHYIEVPESKVNLVETLTKKVETLKNKLNDTTKVAIAERKEKNALAKELIIIEYSDGLNDYEADRLHSLAENLDFENEKSYAQKVKAIRESYFKDDKHVTHMVEEFDTEVETLTEDSAPKGPMDRYVDIIGKMNKD